MVSRSIRLLQRLVVLAVYCALSTYSSPPRADLVEQIRAHTRGIEFDYLSWTLEAAWLKTQAASVGLPHGFPAQAQGNAVSQYLDSTQKILDLERLVEEVYADPAVADKMSASESARAALASAANRLAELAPIAEAVLEEQISQVLVELGLSLSGQPVPGLLYHTTSLPMALIASPRDRIEQVANISVDSALSLDEQVALETQVEQDLGLSSLVVPVGGVGVYPTMVTRSTDVHWLVETISHEWIHNHLTLRPLGVLYDSTPALRTMNETTAAIAGAEIASRVMVRFYPAAASTVGRGSIPVATRGDRPDPGDLPRPPFDFRSEMHTTRIATDGLLEAGKVGEAEAYMESRRLVFLANGFLLRRLNQAYFAFYGAYAETAEGAAGEDPVGEAVRRLRARSSSLADFVARISWMTSSEQLAAAVAVH
jgi:hypothetical protein